MSPVTFDTFNMVIDVLSLIPEVFQPYLETSILGKAREARLLEVNLHNIRDYATGRHKVTDEPPYGGGGGMILKAEPIFKAVEAITGAVGGSGGPVPNQQKLSGESGDRPIILLTPQGRPFNQAIGNELAQHETLLLICGRYEGVDERVRQHLVTDEISIGDYVLTGGELAALVIIDAVVRLIPGALGAAGAAEADSHASGLLEGPHYTRPERFRDWNVPPVLLSGHAAKIAQWRREEALRRTWRRRPELLERANLSEDDKFFLATLAEEEVRK